jgi:hypothetical protein
VLKSGKVLSTVSIYSPVSGYVTESRSINGSGSSEAGTSFTPEVSGGASMSGSASSGSGMGSSNQTPPINAANTPILLKEGQYVAAGQRLFSFINSSSVWAEFYTQPNNLNNFKRGTMLQVQSIDVASKNIRVPVSLIQPYYNTDNPYSVVRATIPNQNKRWKVGELLSITSENKRKIGNWLPRTAVVQLGTKYVAFMKKSEAFVPVYVTINTLSGDWVDVGNSVSPTQEVALNAWFLTDTESFIKPERL